MTWSWALERAYWAGELPRLWRRGWWLLLLLLVLGPFSSTTAVAVFLDFMFIALLVVVALRRVSAGRDLSGVLHRRWQEATSKRLVAIWPGLARNLKLEVRDLRGRPVVAGLGRTAWEGWTCVASVALPPGMARDDLVALTDRIAQAFGALRVTVLGQHLGALALRIDYADPLVEPFSLPLGASWDGKSVLMGIAEGGDEWRLPLGPHTLVAGASGSGKASLVWGLVLGLAQPIHSGLVEVWGIDRKGGMELAMGRELLTRFAHDAVHSVALLEDAVQQMEQRAVALAGVTRQHTASTDSPTVVVLIDELAALTSYETDRVLLRRANAAIATLASQGRAVGFVLFACLQDPRKETLPARGLFIQTVGLRLRDRTETAMVLGDGAVAAGALCHEISPATPGVAYVVSEQGMTERVRAAFSSDDQIREASLAYIAPHPRPIELPEPEAEPKSRRPRVRRTKTTTESEEES